MANKEFIDLMEQNLHALIRLGGRLVHENKFPDYTKNQIAAIANLKFGGRAKLKDIAARECESVQSISYILKTLEQKNLVAHEEDSEDRRNTWYFLTKKGEDMADMIMAEFRAKIAEIFSGLSKEDEKQMTASLKTINSIINKMDDK
jgi:DNA-binding MarR family transcriptional regulator